jgi:TatD DNase family protein
MTTPLIDIGFNFTNKVFRRDEGAVLARALEAGVTRMIVTGTDIEHSEAALTLADRFPEYLYATAGIHPHHARHYQSGDLDHLTELLGHPRAVAVGETGLDYNRNFSPPEAQRRAFEAQLRLAAQLRRPVFLHQRDAHEDFISLLSRHRADLVGAVVHCFTGDAEELAAYLDLDLHIGITGWICDERRGGHLRDLVASIPRNRLMIETDAPYLLPRDLADKPKDRRNEPMFLPQILNAIARSRREDPEQLAKQITATTVRFFVLPAT